VLILALRLRLAFRLFLSKQVKTKQNRKNEATAKNVKYMPKRTSNVSDFLAGTGSAETKIFGRSEFVVLSNGTEKMGGILFNYGLNFFYLIDDKKEFEKIWQKKIIN
jgi:hypothetical protein